MKNTYALIINVDDENVEIEGQCPDCMNDEELRIFIMVIHHILHVAVEVANERIKYGEKKQGSQKKRQKDFRKSCRQNKKD